MKPLLPACVAEFLGTFALTFFGCCSVVVALGKFGNADAPATDLHAALLQIAFAHGLTLAVFVAGCMYISGAQFNPAVSIALVVAGKQPLPRALMFIAVQLFAAACGAGMVQLLLTPAVANDVRPALGATIGQLTRDGNAVGVVGIEAILTFALTFVVLTTAVDDRAHKMAGIFIGLTVAACILVAAPLTGSSMNPARTFGPAICGDHWNMHWAYWLGPMLGACLAAVVYRVFWDKK